MKDTALEDLTKKIKSYNEQLKRYCLQPPIEGIEEFQEGCRQSTVRALLDHQELFYNELNE